MPLTKEQKFKVAFLQKCAEDGLTIQETHQRVKQAAVHLKAILAHVEQLPEHEKRAFLGAALQGGWNALKGVGGWGLGRIPGLLTTLGAVGIAAPIIGGAGLGYAAAKGTAPDKSVVEDAKQDEIVGEYERLAEEAKRRTKLKQLQQTTGKRVFALTPGE
jgi:hypothetical protein